MLDERGLVRESPAKYGPVGADADDVSLVGADLDSSHRRAVAQADVGHLALVVYPNLPNSSEYTVWWTEKLTMKFIVIYTVHEKIVSYAVNFKLNILCVN